MIRNISIKSFKSLLDVKIELGKINVFVGANGSGKSNLLEAIGMLSAAAGGRVNDATLRARGVRPGIYKSPFCDSIRIEAADAQASYAVELTDEIIEHSPASALMDVLRDFSIYTPTTDTLRGLLADPQRREPVGLSGGRLPEAVAEVLQYCKSDKRAASAVAKVKELINWTTEYPVSEGELYVLLMLVLAVHPKAHDFLAIDNADHGLNPRLARALMECVCEWILGAPTDKQLLLTTHNPLMLDGLPLDNDEVCLFAVDRSRKGRTVVERVKVDVKQLFRDGEVWTVGRLWVNGHLGGMPGI